MENLKTTGDCGCNTGCSCNEISAAELFVKNLNIDFLYLDLSTCERCMATDETLKKALDILSGVFDTLGYRVQLNSVNITSKELAQEYRFLSSPTIRVNGVDICNEVKESDCTDCGGLCGDSVDCRVFVYEGKEYEQPPVSMIVDGILKAIYGENSCANNQYTLPENLNKFFTGKNNCCTTGCSCDDKQLNKETPENENKILCCENITAKELLGVSEFLKENTGNKGQRAAGQVLSSVIFPEDPEARLKRLMREGHGRPIRIEPQ